MTGLGQALRGEARDALVFTGTNLLNRLGGLLLLPLYWTKLVPADYGVLAVVAVIAAFQTLLASLSLDLAITRFYYEWPETDRRRNLGAIWVWNWLATIAVGAAFLVLMRVIGPLLFPDVAYDPWLVLGIVGNTLANLFVVPASTIRIKRLPWLFAAYNLVGFGAGACLGLWLVLGLDLGLIGMMISIISANLVLAAIGALAMLRFSQPALSAPGLREAIGFSLPAMPSALIGAIAGILDRFLLSYFTSLQILGLYSVALRFVDVLGALHNSLKMTYGPFMMRNISAGGREGRAAVVAMTPYYLVPYFAACLGLIYLIGPLVRTIGQAEYFGVESIVPWLAGVQIVGTLYFYYCNGMFLGKRTDLLAIPAIVHLVVLAAASIVLIGSFQLAGLIASRYVGAVVFFLLSLHLSQRAFHLDHRWGALIGIAALTTAFAVIGELLPSGDLAPELGVKAVLWFGFVGLSLWLVSGGRFPSSIRRASDLWRA